MAEVGLIIAWILITLIGIVVLTTVRSNAKGAPWLPTSRKKIIKMLELADLKPNECLYDLGCGDGRVIVIAARKFGAKAVGIEVDPFRFLWCQFLITALGLRKKVKVIFGDIFKQKYPNADLLFCYLLQSTNDKLEAKLIEELPAETRILSNTFMFSSLPIKKMDAKIGCFLYEVGLKPAEKKNE